MTDWLHAPYREKPQPPSRWTWFWLGFCCGIGFCTLVIMGTGPTR